MYKFKHSYWGEEWQEIKIGEGVTDHSSRSIARLVAELLYSELGYSNPKDFDTYVEVMKGDQIKKYRVQTEVDIRFTTSEV